MAQPHPDGLYPLTDHPDRPDRDAPAGPTVTAAPLPSPAVIATPLTPTRGRRLLRWLLLITIAAAAGVALRLTVLAPKPVPVDVVPVTYGTVEETVSNTRAGTVKARVRAGLSPEAAGRVVALPFKEGERVAAGALLLRLDDAIPRARMAVAVEDLNVAEARAEEACLAADLAASELSRFVQLKAQGIASDQVLDSLTSERDRSRAACRAAAAAGDQARARQSLARAELALTEIRAPFAGIVAEIATELGEWITPAPTGIALPAVIDLLDPSSLYITAPIDEMDAARIKPGQEVRLSVDSHRGQHFSGYLVRVAPYVLDAVEQNRTVEVEAELAEPAGKNLVDSLLPGTSADVEVIIARRQQVLQVPTAAIAQGGKVLVVGSEGVLEERTITTGLGNWSTTEVVDGLTEGELVVSSRDSKAVKAGTRVVIRNGHE